MRFRSTATAATDGTANADVDGDNEADADVRLYSTRSSECCAHSMSRIALMPGRAALDLSYLILLTILLPLKAQT